MSSWEIAPLRETGSRREDRAVDRLARRAVFAAFSRLSQGRILLKEGAGEHFFGAGEFSATIEVFDSRFYSLVARSGAIGAAEAYSRGYWESESLVDLFRIFVRRIGKESALESRVAWIGSVPGYFRQLLRRNGRRDSRRNIEAHYDLGNDFFELFLDPSLTYSSGIFETPLASLEEASEAKLRRIALKLGLRPGMRVAEIGCGWGSFATLAAREFGCHVTGVTLSKQQHAEAMRRVRESGLDDRVQILLKDYRDLEGSFDRIASIEMVEAIGHARLGEYFATCSRLLKPDGLMVIQAITMPDQGYEQYLRRTDVIRHHIFPGSNCPSRTALLEAASRHSPLRAVHLGEIGPHYATTLRLWRERFVNRLPDALSLGYPREFLRLWHFYLCYCEAGFAERHVGNVQIVLAMPAYRGSLEFDCGPIHKTLEVCRDSKEETDLISHS